MFLVSEPDIRLLQRPLIRQNLQLRLSEQRPDISLNWKTIKRNRLLRRTEKSHLAIEGVVLQFERADTVDISGQTVIQETQLSLLLSPRREFKIKFFLKRRMSCKKTTFRHTTFFLIGKEKKKLCVTWKVWLAREERAVAQYAPRQWGRATPWRRCGCFEKPLLSEVVDGSYGLET